MQMTAVTVTKQMLHEARTPQGGFTRAQVECLGEKWPLKKGWLRRLAGKTVPIDQWNTFRNLGRPPSVPKPARRPNGRFDRMARKLKSLGYSSYSEYLFSKHWDSFKLRYKAAGQPMKCAICKESPVQLHHNTYNTIGAESFSDVTPLCDLHHTAVHQWLDDRVGGKVSQTPEAVKWLREVLK